jgi:hypothetical protein
MMSPTLLLVAALLGEPSSPQALCIYKGELYATTTIAQEYADSRWVVRARVTAQTDSWTDAGPEYDEAPWTTYRIEVVEVFKGDAPRVMTVFTERNSGGFYLQPPGSRFDPDVDYLLFLNPTHMRTENPPEARGTAEVNYSCGQSKPWHEVPASDRRALLTLAR